MKKVISDVLKRLEDRSILEKSRKIDVPSDEKMLAITKDTGQFFNSLLYSKNAKNMLEIGTSYGYSTIWCAEAIMNNHGKVFTIENNPKKIKIAKQNFDESSLTNFIEILKGNAVDILKENQNNFKEFFDFVLIDADKENCVNYFDLVLPMTKIGGMILTDNILYPEKYQKEMKEFTEYINNISKVRTVTIPIGNGEEFTIKIKR